MVAVMKHTTIRRSCSCGLWIGLTLLATTGSAAGEKPLLSELLEAGVYQEEAVGDLEAAIGLYQQVVGADEINRPLAAEAQYRLAVCYQKQGNQSMAVRAFEALVKNYPNQTRWVDEALKHLPKPFEPGLIPWVDGETEVLEIRLPTGAVVGYSFYRTERVNQGGRDLWRITNRTLASVDLITTVEIDPASQKPVFGYFSGDGAPDKAIRWWFDDDQIRSIYGEDPEEKITPFDGRVIDNLQAQYLVRQLPIEVGFSTQQTIFVGMSGALVPVQFTVVAVETIETPLGNFEAAKTEIDLGVQKQYIWTSTDRDRRLLKFKVGGVEILASRFEVVEPGEIQTYRNGDMNLEIDLPADWGVFNNPEHDDKTKRARIEIRMADDMTSYSVTMNRDSTQESETAPPVTEDARKIAENHIKGYEREAESFVVDEGSWEAGPLAGGEMVSFSGEMRKGDQEMTVKKVVVKVGDLAVVFTMRSHSDGFAEREPGFDRIFESLRVD